jgi:hypothetical protein
LSTVRMNVRPVTSGADFYSHVHRNGVLGSANGWVR